MPTIEAAVMTTQEVANRFNELAQTGQWNQVQDELYADNCVSIEPPQAAAMGMSNAEGIDAIKKKAAAFDASVEAVHGGYSKEPQVAGNHFAVAMGMDCTFKGAGRTKMDEIAVYEVKNGKIVKEQFFF
jgi:exopolysaccharide biosynthesis protein